MWLSDTNSITGYEQTGCTLSMFANRLSFFFDFKGPSKAVDTGAKGLFRLHALLLPPGHGTSNPTCLLMCAFSVSPVHP